MRILKIVPGSEGSFPGGNYLRDEALVAELRWAGHDVVLLPLCLPIAGATAESLATVPLFYGAARIYLEHRFAFIRRSPGWFKGLLDHPRMLRRAARRIDRTASDRIAGLVLSLLRGENGGQARELDALAEWIKNQTRPDVIHVSNALFLGLARRLRAVHRIPVVFSMQDEDIWINSLPGSWPKRIWSEMRARAPDVATFIAVSHFAATKIPGRLGVSPKIIRVVHPGLDLTAYPKVAPPAPPVWGVVCDGRDKNRLDLFLRTLIAVRSRPGCETLKLHLALEPASSNARLIQALQRRISRIRELQGVVRIFPSISRPAEKQVFLRSLTVLTTHNTAEPAFDGLLIEAMACGVVLLLPDRGGNPEILAMAEGGILYDSARADALVEPLAELITNQSRHSILAHRGRHGVEHGFGLDRMARETVEAYKAAIASQTPLEPYRKLRVIDV